MTGGNIITKLSSYHLLTSIKYPTSFYAYYIDSFMLPVNNGQSGMTRTNRDGSYNKVVVGKNKMNVSCFQIRESDGEKIPVKEHSEDPIKT
jgi:hypothetical protein